MPNLIRPKLSSLVLVTAMSVLAGCGGRTQIYPPTVNPGTGGEGGAGTERDGGPGNDARQADGGGMGGAAGDGGMVASLVGIDVTPALNMAPVGTQITLVATGRYSDGTTADLTATATWTSSKDAVATVAAGTVACRQTGTATITATTLGQSGTATVTVTAATVTGLQVNPIAPKVASGAALQLSAIALFSDGSKLDVTAMATWTSADGGIATITGTGLVTGHKAATVSITATYQGLKTSVDLIVTAADLVSIEINPQNPTLPENIKVQFQAVGVYNDNSRADLTAQVGWTSSASNVLVIDAATGAASTLAAGTSVVTARVGAISAATSVTVIAAQLNSIEVRPANATIPIAGRQQFTAWGHFSDGTVREITSSVAWAGDGKIASVSNAAATHGLATGLAAGKTQVTANLLGVTGSANLTVTAATLVGLVIQPASVTLPAGTQASLKVIATFSDMTMSDLTQQATWSVADGRVGAVSNTAGSAGLVSALRPGSTQVTAQVGGLSASAALRVTDALLQSITVAPPALSVALGLTASYTATGHYSDGSTIDITQLVTWFVDDTTLASISNLVGMEGQVTPKAIGATSVRAVLSGITGTALLTVTGPVVAGLAITPANPMTHAGQTIQLAATATYSDASTQNVTTTSTWSSADATIATVDNLGLATCRRAGQVNITAAYMGFNATVRLVCTAPVIVRIQVVPFLVSLYVGQTQNFTANLIYSDGTTQGVTNLATWSSSDANIVRVTNMGRRGTATAVAVGSAKITATYMGFSDTTDVTVLVRTLTGIAVSPVLTTLHVGQAQQFQATALYSDGSSVNVTQQALWSTSAPAVADVTTAGGIRGRATALSLGTTTITATYMGFSDSATLNVTAPVLTSIAVSPVSATLHIGQVQVLQVTAIFDDGSTVMVTGQASFNSVDPTIADVTNGFNRGRVTGLSPGTTDIVATYMGFTDKAIISVDAGKLVGLSVTPADQTFPVGTVQTPMTATALYDDMTTADVTAFVAWTSSMPGVADVTNGSNRGLLTTFTPGTTTITVMWMNLSGSTSVTVTP